MLNSLVTLLFAAPLALILFWIMREDVRARRIPNGAVLALFALWPVQLLAFDRPEPWWSGPAASAIVLTAGLIAWHFRLLGGGDAKLAAALSALIGLEGLLGFLLATALLGGVLALGLLAIARTAPALAFLEARFVPTRLRGRVARVLPRRAGGRRLTVPYGVALALAAVLVLVWPPPR